MSVCNFSENNLKISIIIPTLNRADYLKLTLKSLIQQIFLSTQFEIIIVDGGSTDNTKNICDKLIKKNLDYLIRYVYEPEPGLLAGRHRGVLETKGEILTFIDDDIEASPDWLYFIYEAFKDPSIHLVGGKNLPKYKVNPPSWLKYLWGTTPYGGKMCTHLSLLDLGDNTIIIHPNYIFGLNFSIRKKTFFEVGGFHPDSYPKMLQRFQGDGETGLTMKLFEKGYKAIYHPSVIIFHIIPANRMTIEYFEKRMYFSGVGNSYSNIRRNYNKISNIHKFSIKFMKDLAKKCIFNIIKISLFKILFYLTNPADIRDIKNKMRIAYNNGYRFHHTQVKNDLELLKWILKENYWDYQLPGDLQMYDISDKNEKSY